MVPNNDKSSAMRRPLDFDSLKTISIFQRSSKVSVDRFGSSWKVGGSLSRFLNGLPRILAAGDLVEAVLRVAGAVRNKKVVVLGMGAHPIKVGLSLLINQALNHGIFSAVATNGASVIHDVEIALSGKTSESVEKNIVDGSFGAVAETAEFIHEAINEGYNKYKNMGMGWNIGRKIYEDKLPYRDFSIFAALYKNDKIATVHVAIGTDIIHFHPLMDAEKLGALTFNDFRIFCRVVSNLNGGVYINLGSAVIMPEVFLKALSVVRNLGYDIDDITTINMDFALQYRPLKNVVERPTGSGGKGYNFIGHHEIMFPLFLAAVFEQLSSSGC